MVAMSVAFIVLWLAVSCDAGLLEQRLDPAGRSPPSPHRTLRPGWFAGPVFWEGCRSLSPLVEVA
jgi:hypothetical protein